MTETTYKIIAGEQQTDDWQKLREGKITGSNAKKVKGTGDAFLYETLAMMLTQRDPKQAYGEHVDRGNELEPVARKAYTDATGEKVAQVAFIEDESGRVGFSPDGLVWKRGGKEIKKLLEIKCPDTNNHIRYIVEKRIPAEHKDQIIHAFVVCDDVDELDFVSYDPKFRFKPLFILTVKRSSLVTEIATAKIAYDRFLQKLDSIYQSLIL